eukprot:s2522_g6.t1
MPLEVWLECICAETRFGEELVAVGNHPAFGDWSVERGVHLRTGQDTFPIWTLTAPLLVAEEVGENGWLLGITAIAENVLEMSASKDCQDMPLWLEYKYVIRDGHGNCRWEDFGVRSLPMFSSTSPASATMNLLQLSQGGKPLNRLLPFCRGRRLKPGLVLRIDTFGSWAAKTEATWHATNRWGPDVAGMSAEPSVHSSNEVSALCGSSFLFVSGAAVHRGSIENYAARIFAAPRRSRLLLALAQVRQKVFDRMPPETWLPCAGCTHEDSPFRRDRWTERREHHEPCIREKHLIASLRRRQELWRLVIDFVGLLLNSHGEVLDVPGPLDCGDGPYLFDARP